MRVAPFFLIVCAVVWLCVYGCAKPKTDPTEYDFENLADKDMNVDIYATQQDYFNNTNIISHGRARIRGYNVVPFSMLTLGKVYYMDIYSDDYLYTNWFWNNTTLRDTFVPTKTSYTYIIQHTQFADPSRSIWLNGAGPSTTWKAFDAYHYSSGVYTSVWSTLSSAEQSLTIMVKKSSQAVLTNTGGLDTTVSFMAFYDTVNHVSDVTMLNADRSQYGALTSYFNATAHTFNGSKDTMLANIPSLGFFAMARQ